MRNFIIYSILIHIISFLFFSYNKKKHPFFLVFINIFILTLILISLVFIVKSEIEILSTLFICIYIIGLNLLNYLIIKNKIVKNSYLKFSLIFYLLSSLWFFLLSFIVVIIGILTGVSGL